MSIYIPPPAIRAVREQCRSRQQLVRLRTRVVQMLRALLLRTGAPDAPMRQLYAARGLTWLGQVPWPAEAVVSGPRLTQLLRVVQGEVVPAEAALRADGSLVGRSRDAFVAADFNLGVARVIPGIRLCPNGFRGTVWSADEAWVAMRIRPNALELVSFRVDLLLG